MVVGGDGAEGGVGETEVGLGVAGSDFHDFGKGGDGREGGKGV